ncbi:hypothetical protein MBLNU230_g3883t1 [Neophaeotheca triangularis]
MPSNASALRRIICRIGNPPRPSGVPRKTLSTNPDFSARQWQRAAAGQTAGSGVPHHPSRELRGPPGGEDEESSAGRGLGNGAEQSAQNDRSHADLPEQRQADPYSGSRNRAGPHGKEPGHPNTPGAKRNAPQRALVEDEGATPDSHETSRPPKIRILKSTDRKPQPQVDAFAEAVESSRDRQRDGNAFRKLKSQKDLGPRYLTSYADAQRTRRLKQGVRVKLMWHRQGPQSKDWRTALKMLEENSPTGSEHYVKHMETVRLPMGVEAEFLGNAGERVLEVMQRTGCHIQLLGDRSKVAVKKLPTNSRFDSLALYGTPGQNAAAIALLPSLVEIVVEDDLNASRNLTDYHLHSEETKQHPQYPGHTDDPADSAWLNNSLDNELERAVESITNPIRAVWFRDQATDAAPAPSIQSPALALTERIRYLTAPTPRLKDRKLHGTQDPTKNSPRLHAILDEVLSLIRNSEDVTNEALTLAVNFFTEHDALPQLRALLDSASNSSPGAVTAPIYDRVLASCAQAQSVVDFRHSLALMLQQNFQPTADTWIHFHTLISLRFEREAGTVADKMREKGILSSPPVCAAIVQNTIERSLSQHLGDNESFGAFISKIDSRWPGIRWLTRSTGNRMLKLLLARGQRDNAFLVFDLMLSRRVLPKADTLNTFLASPYRDQDLPGILAILARFDETCTKPIAFNQYTYRMLFKIAWRKRYWNVLRVVWRYAVCAGFVDFPMQDTIQKSLTAPLQPTLSPKSKKGTTGSRQEIFHALAGKFAIGLIDGLKSQSQESDAKPEPETPTETPAENTFTLKTRRSSLLSLSATETSTTRLHSLRSLLKAELSEVQSLRPCVPILAKLQEALEKDLRWKKRSLGLPTGLKAGERYASLNAGTHGEQGVGLLVELLKHGVSVPVAVGDGTRVERSLPDGWMWWGNSVGGEEGREAAWKAQREGVEFWQAEEWEGLEAEQVEVVGGSELGAEAGEKSAEGGREVEGGYMR